ncbi:Isochorismatase-like protein [Massariosphaeria phaeospora]|uniref:Isochorismatase-like protein n=1 Tax=Massariosphaeria phaeospora TaxID=100035 RepID=A0A7C8IDX4_9PLEO|nr:Isochorismatase-like protein [Massariosphaeria phaeospora]
MRFGSSIAVLALGLCNAVCADAVPYERLDKNNAVLVILDIQVGLFQLVRDWDPTLYRDNALAHAGLGQAFNLPVVLSTSAETGPNGPLLKPILDMYPNAPLVRRQGEVNAYDSPAFRAALTATNRTQVLIAGITTDVCTTFLALSLRAAGYSVFANIEASGTTSTLVRDAANARMAAAGVQLLSLFAVVSELMRDWRATPGAKELLPWLDEHMPVYGYLARAHRAAVEEGVVIPGEGDLN